MSEIKDITLVIRPKDDGHVYEIWSPSHPHIKIVQRPPQPSYYGSLIQSLLNQQQQSVSPQIDA
jgi:hypothetical protein